MRIQLATGPLVTAEPGKHAGEGAACEAHMHSHVMLRGRQACLRGCSRGHAHTAPLVCMACMTYVTRMASNTDCSPGRALVGETESQ